LYQFNEIGAGTGGGAAALTLETALFRSFPAQARGRSAIVPPAREKPRGLSDRLAGLRLATDLGDNIGSLEWVRGFAMCAGLCYAAWSFAPGLQPLSAPAPAPLADAQWEQARALAISPLAYGADTGRRMAPTDAVVPLTDTPERPTVDLLASIGRGGSFARDLERAGVAAHDAAEAASLVSSAIAMDTINAGTTVDLTLGRRSNKSVARPLNFLAFRADFDLKIEIRRVGTSLRLARIPIAVDNTPLRLQGRAGASLYRSARAAGAPAKAVEAYIRAIATQMDVGRIAADDRFDIIVERRRAATGETEMGQLLYAGLDRSKGKTLQLMAWNQDGKSQWFEATGVGKSSGLFQRPVPGVVTSNFGRRMHPILGYSRMHKGMDFRAGYGTPILAAADGRVARAGWTGGYGQQVRINHDNSFATSYSHMSRMVAKAGQFVKRGQIIGYVGTTGLSTGPHLHYELYRNGVQINPASVKYTTRAQLSGPALASFRNKLRKLLSVPANGSGEQTAKAPPERQSSRS
jgi:murein DD-endopeptidase MepM/ murein hydrolase activator NlpD